MRQLPPSRSSAGYSPNRLQPLAVAPVLDQGQRLTDIQAIQRLFANGENGGYWPADPAFLYEDSAGTIPASLNGVVGLWMDASKGLALGPNLAVNGNFDSDTGWSGIAASWSIANGLASNNGTNASNANLVTNTNIDLKYKLFKFRLTVNSNSGRVSIIIGGINRSDIFSNGYYENTIFVSDAGSNTIIYIQAAPFAVVNIDAITVNEILGNHAFQQTTANKPYLRRTPVSEKYWLDSNTNTGALTATFSSSLGSACTIATVGAEGVTIAENQTVGTTYNITPIYGYNGDVLIINRALTAVEKALVTRVMQRNVPTLENSVIPTYNTIAVYNLVNCSAISENSEITFTKTTEGSVFLYGKVAVNTPSGHYILKIRKKTLGYTFLRFIGSTYGSANYADMNMVNNTDLQITVSYIPSNVFVSFASADMAIGNSQTFSDVSLNRVI